MTNQIQERTLAERREGALERLRSNSNLWLATASDGPAEFSGRTVMRAGAWLDEPVD